jgi:16S rRNA (cytosine1402-N4)-methyltransferase
MHTPVLLQNAVDALNVHEGGLYIDATLGEAGHFSELIKRGGKVLGIDWDQTQVNKAAEMFKTDKAQFVFGNYADIEEIARSKNFFPVDGVLFDLGLSMAQLREGNRGLSFKKTDEPLDMRINIEEEMTAADFLNTASEDELYEVFAKYSEDLDSQVIAHEVVTRKRNIQTVGDITDVVRAAFQHCSQHHQHDLNRTLTRIFQALRIVVNKEFENIKKGLNGAVQILKPDGVIAIISFHSAEDRIIKQFVRENGLKAVETVKGNKELSFERSATLRIIGR